MTELKFRTPVVCQNGHKAYWYFELDQRDGHASEIKNHGVPKDQNCKCPKGGLDEGWRRAGADEQYTGIKTWITEQPIYEGDVLQNGTFIWVVKRYVSGAYNVKVDENGQILKTTTKVIGSQYLNSYLRGK